MSDRKEYKHQWYLKNKERLAKKYRSRSPLSPEQKERARERARLYRENNPQKGTDWNVVKSEDPERYAEHIDYHRRYYKTHKDEINKQNQEYYKAHAEEIKEQTKRYMKANPEKAKTWDKKSKKKNVKNFSFVFTQKEIVDKLESCGNINSYIKSLISKDIDSGGFPPQTNFEFTRCKPKRILIALSKNTQAHIIKKLESVPNKTDYIRRLIIADMDKEEMK